MSQPDVLRMRSLRSQLQTCNRHVKAKIAQEIGCRPDAGRGYMREIIDHQIQSIEKKATP